MNNPRAQLVYTHNRHSLARAKTSSYYRRFGGGAKWLTRLYSQSEA